MGGNFRFQAQDSFFGIFFWGDWEIGRFEKRISFSEKGTFSILDYMYVLIVHT